MDIPIDILLAFMIALMFAAVGFGLVKGRKPEAALMLFIVGLFISAFIQLIELFIPITLMMILALMMGWKYAKGY